MTYTLTLSSPAATLTAGAAPERTLTGLLLPYGPVGRTSAGPVTAGPGSVTLPQALRRVKLFDRHDEGRESPEPVGYLQAATDTPAGLHTVWRIARTPGGDAALLAAAEGTRDALSVELDDVQLDPAGHLTGSTLRSAAQVPVPAFADARLTATRKDHPAMPTTEHTEHTERALPTEDTKDTKDTEPVPADQGTTEPAPAAQTPAAGSLNASPGAAAALTGARPGRALAAAAARISAALSGALDAGEANRALTAALADIVPSTSGSDALTQPAFIGELWTPRAALRPMINLFGSTPLTAMRWLGWRWETEPTVGPWEGEKKAIPTSPAKIAPADGEAHRIAAGWDFDRVYVDFPTGFVEAFMAAATRDYERKSEAALAAFVAAGATDAGTAATFAEAVNLICTTLGDAGAAVSGIFMAPDVWTALIGLDQASVPWWMLSQASVNLGGQSVDLADITVGREPALPAGTVLGADRDAIDFRETGPIRVQAVNIPQGGIDLALFGYQGEILHDARGVAKATVTAAAPGAAKAK